MINILYLSLHFATLKFDMYEVPYNPVFQYKLNTAGHEAHHMLCFFLGFFVLYLIVVDSRSTVHVVRERGTTLGKQPE